MAKSLSAVFGAGIITGSDGQKGEAALFGKPNRWIDYSGPIGGDWEDSDRVTVEGLTLIDHQSNPAHPAKWHVRDDGWIGPSLSRDADVPLTPDKPLTVRYLLVVHSGGVNPQLVNQLADAFDRAPGLQVIKGTKPHHQWELKIQGN